MKLVVCKLIINNLFTLSDYRSVIPEIQLSKSYFHILIFIIDNYTCCTLGEFGYLSFEVDIKDKV